MNFQLVILTVGDSEKGRNGGENISASMHACTTLNHLKSVICNFNDTIINWSHLIITDLTRNELDVLMRPFAKWKITAHLIVCVDVIEVDICMTF